MNSPARSLLAAIGYASFAAPALAQVGGYQSPLDLLGIPKNADAAAASNAGCGPFPCSNARLLANLPPSTWSAVSGNDCWGYTSPSGREYALMCLSNGTAVIDITIPGSASTVAHLSGPSSNWRDVKTYENYVYIVSEGGGGIQVFDMSEVDNGVINALPAAGSGTTHNVAIDTTSGFLYRAGTPNGLLIYDIGTNPAVPVQVAAWTAGSVHDLQVVTYTTGPFAGRQIGFLSTNFVLTTLDVTDKSNLAVIGQVPFGGVAHQSWLSDDKRYCYLDDELSTGASKTFVFDALDPANLILLGSYSNGNPSYHHNLYVNGDFVYEANYKSGLRVFDIGVSPTNPPEVAFLDTYPANNGTGSGGLWSNYPFFPSGVVIGSDKTVGFVAAWFGPPLLGFAFPSGQPTTINASGDTLRVSITPQGAGAILPGTEMLHLETDVGPQHVPLTSLGGGLYDAAFPPLPCGTFVRYYVSASSTNNIVWTSPESAPAATWSLTATCPNGPFTYCVAKTNSCGGVPALSFVGTSSAAQSSGFRLDASGAASGKAGLMLYTNQGTGSIPFQGGTLCVQPSGVRRGPAAVETGATPGNCDGVFSTDINAFAAGALGVTPSAYLSVPGTTVNVQQWGRDTGTSYLSNAGQYVVGP